MELRLREFRPRIGPHEHRVVQPGRPLRHTSLRDPSALAPYGMLVGDHDGLSRLAGLFSFAAFSRHTIVHVPLRDCVPSVEGCGELVDLVLAHPEAGLRPSKWPELRRALRRDTPLTARTDETRTERHARAWLERPYDRRLLRHTAHARTYFLIGGRDAFASAATSFAYAADQGPRQKGVLKGRLMYMDSVGGEPAPHGDGSHDPEVLICFKEYPTDAHLKRPGH